MHEKDRIVEIGELRSIFTSKTFRRILQERKAHHQIKVNEFIRAKDLISAYGALCKMDDLDKLLDRIEMHLNELTEEAKK